MKIVHGKEVFNRKGAREVCIRIATYAGGGCEEHETEPQITRCIRGVTAECRDVYVI